MRVSEDAIIAREKLTHYLLAPRPFDDKSRYLGQAGFTLETWSALGNAIRQLARSVEAMEDGMNEYGTFYRTQGRLVGPAARLEVVLIWMQREVDGRFHFVTLKPAKG